MSKKESNTNPVHEQHTTFDTWNRVAHDQLERMSAWSNQVTQMQLAALDHMRDAITYSAKLTSEWQSFMIEAGRKVSEGVFTQNNA
jgi:hypothetical protein